NHPAPTVWSGEHAPPAHAAPPAPPVPQTAQAPSSTHPTADDSSRSAGFAVWHAVHHEHATNPQHPGRLPDGGSDIVHVEIHITISAPNTLIRKRQPTSVPAQLPRYRQGPDPGAPRSGPDQCGRLL